MSWSKPGLLRAEQTWFAQAGLHKLGLLKLSFYGFYGFYGFYYSSSPVGLDFEWRGNSAGAVWFTFII